MIRGIWHTFMCSKYLETPINNALEYTLKMRDVHLE